MSRTQTQQPQQGTTAKKAAAPKKKRKKLSGKTRASAKLRPTAVNKAVEALSSMFSSTSDRDQDELTEAAIAAGEGVWWSREDMERLMDSFTELQIRKHTEGRVDHEAEIAVLNLLAARFPDGKAFCAADVFATATNTLRYQKDDSLCVALSKAIRCPWSRVTCVNVGYFLHTHCGIPYGSHMLLKGGSSTGSVKLYQIVRIQTNC